MRIAWSLHSLLPLHRSFALQRKLLLLLGYLTISTAFDITCNQVNSRGHCVHKGLYKKNWSGSEAFCSARGGHLTSIHKAEDIDAIRALGDPNKCMHYWTGGQCRNGNCSWVDGSSLDFVNFGESGECTSRSEETDTNYRCIASTFEEGKWRTANCYEEKCFVCETRVAMRHCAEWRNAGYTDDGVYSIVVNGKPYRVYCDMHTAGGGWVVFQRRVDGSDSFWNHNWTEYRNGFGEMGQNTNFWLGNEVLHQLTAKDPNVTLRVEMRGDRTPNSKNPDGFWWNHYFKFRIGPEERSYPLESLTIDWRNIEGNASTGWYDITYSVGAQFSTIDRINDPSPNCVTHYKMGGWWLHNCALATLNGAYDLPKYSTGGYVLQAAVFSVIGLFWIINGMDQIIHPRETTMMLRPSQ